MADLRESFCKGVAEEVAKRWPEIVQTPGSTLRPTFQTGSFSYHQLQLRLPDSGYNYVHVMFENDIFVDADGDYGPNMNFQYQDPDCVENVMAFIAAIMDVPKEEGLRRYAGQDTIDLSPYRAKP